MTKPVPGAIFLVLLALVGGFLAVPTLINACSPEPGPQHFQRPPQATPPPMLIGCFEVHNTLNGLPANEIRCVLAGEGWAMAGSDGAGLMIFEDGGWRSLLPGEDGRGFPARTVTSLARLPDGSVLAGTPTGLVKLTHEGRQWRIENNPLSGATSRNLLSILPTTEGLFVGTDNGAGMVVSNALNPLKLEGVFMPTGFSSSCRRGSDVLFGCSHGLFLRQSDLLLPYSLGDLDPGWVNALAVLGEHLVVGGSKGLLKVKGNGGHTVLPDLWITALGAAPGLTDIPGDTPDRSEESGQLTGALGNITNTLAPGFQEKIGEDLKRLDEICRWSKNSANWPSPEWEAKAGEFFKLYDEIMQKCGEKQVANRPTQPLLKGLWVGTQQDGVVLFPTDGQRRQFTRENSKLPSNRVTCISVGEDGETWIGTADGGLLRYFRQPILMKCKVWPVFEGKVETIRLMGDRFYVGTTEQGLHVFDPQTLQLITAYTDATIKGFPRKVTGVGLDPQGRLWVGGDTGVWRLDEKGWRHFPLIDVRTAWEPGQPLPKSLPVTVLNVDGNGRVFAAADLSGPLSEQIFRLMGDRFVSFSRETIRQALTMAPASTAIFLKELGLTETWGRQFDSTHASMSLAFYEKAGESLKVTALLDTPHYLFIGTREGVLNIFDGQSFKPLSTRGSGILGPIVALGKRANGDLVILGEGRGQVFDGETYRPMPPIPEAKTLSDFCFDDLNPDCYWVCWRSGLEGFALNQGSRWLAMMQNDPVHKIAVLDPYVFIATPHGAFRWAKR